MNQGLSDRYKTLFEQFQNITQREKMLILVAGAVVIIMVGYMLFIEPLNEKIVREAQDLAAQHNQYRSVEAQLAVSEQLFNNDPNLQLADSLAKLTQRMKELDTHLQHQTVNLVRPTQMPMLLEKVLADSEGVTLVSMQSIAPTAVLSTTMKNNDEKEINDDVNTSDDINLYRHGVMLSVKGSYFDIQRYLTKIESLKWQFYWKRFNYAVDNYPNALVEVELYTLSTSEAFIGV
ncbi:type II secretion system protein GspM [Paraglaciecola sp. L1A13]|uniref:type II secretion system protein GspM n=1 Tax=Paraglaciecola sp. L1A13 TaxID=2686359 RepID=UPI00131CACCF|nr:type II secretion system protein GspM [Paraglaciecola sp. L1A13]